MYLSGKAFAMFWAIFNFGSFIGAVIALAINIRSGGLTAVSTSTYIVRIKYTVFGVANPDKISLGFPRHNFCRSSICVPRTSAQSRDS